MKARELRELGVAELEQLIREKSQELADLRIKHKSNTTMEKPGRLRILRRDVARMLTIKAQREAN